MAIIGEDQGNITGSSFKQGQEDKIEVLAFDHLVELPARQDTQVTTGDPLHRPITLSKEVDGSTPKLYQALCRREILESVEIRWFRHNPDGKEELFYMITLTNALIVRMQPWGADFLDERLEHYRPMEKVAMAYEAIRWSWGLDGDVEYEAVWDVAGRG
jgi:type VI secretion system secreted protein Hcp